MSDAAEGDVRAGRANGVVVTTLPELIAGLQAEGDGWRARVTADWGQGRTLYGGITAALTLEAARRTAGGDLPPLRAAQVAFVGPASGEGRLTAEVLRRGRSAMVAEASLTAEGGDKGPSLATRALFTFGAARESAVRQPGLPCPQVPPAADCPPFHKEGKGPEFARQFEMRAAAEARLLSGHDPHLLVWVRHRHAAGVDGAVALLALADALPPAAMVIFPRPGPISSMTWAVEMTGPVDDDPEGWRLISSRSETAADGYSLQAMTVWDAEGRPLMAARQMVALFV